MLESLHIKNYKLFEDLKMDNLARVNLISGKNNVGKTALLEALRLYAGEGESSIMENIIKKRGDDDQLTKEEFASLFFNNDFTNTLKINNIKIGYKLLEDNNSSNFQILRYNAKNREDILVREIFNLKSKNSSDPRDKAVFIPASIDFDNSQLWDEISLTPKEDDVIEALKLVIPKIIRLSISARGGKVKIRIEGHEQPFPLKNFGDGTSRIFTIALGMVNASDNILLIDEFETGLHYSLQKKLWDFVFKLAKKFNVQVFATTHSWDCIDAFSEVSGLEENKGEGKYFRLDIQKPTPSIKLKVNGISNPRRDKIIAIEYTQEELETATTKRIETR